MRVSATRRQGDAETRRFWSMANIRSYRELGVWLTRCGDPRGPFAPTSVKHGVSGGARPILSVNYVWLAFALRCAHLSQVQVDELDDMYDKVIAQLVRMLSAPEQWSIR